jgi:hypothetical protein
MSMGILEREEFKRMQARLQNTEDLLQQCMTYIRQHVDANAFNAEGTGEIPASQGEVDRSSRAVAQHTGFGRWTVLYDGERVPVQRTDPDEWIVQGHWYTKDGATEKARQLNADG